MSLTGVFSCLLRRDLDEDSSGDLCRDRIVKDVCVPPCDYRVEGRIIRLNLVNWFSNKFRKKPDNYELNISEDPITQGIPYPTETGETIKISSSLNTIRSTRPQKTGDSQEVPVGGSTRDMSQQGRL